MANPQDLPMELLLRIIEHEEKPSEKQRLVSAIRGTCAALHARTLHYFGSRHLTHIQVSFTEGGILSLRATSQSPLSASIKNLVIDADTLYQEIFKVSKRRRMPIYTEPAPIKQVLKNCACILNESVGSFIEGGGYKQVLGDTFSRRRDQTLIRIPG